MGRSYVKAVVIKKSLTLSDTGQISLYTGKEIQGHCQNHRVKSPKNPLRQPCFRVKPFHLYLDNHLLTSTRACQGRIDGGNREHN